MSPDYSEKNYSVLIADDNQNNLKVLSSMLETLGYRIRVAKTGEQTFQSVEMLKPDIILLDIHMPGMDGYEVCARLKAVEKYRNIPVIFISALSEVFNKIQAFTAGGVDYITKPFELEEVRLRIETHIRLRENTSKLEKALADLQRKESLLVQSEKMAALGILTAGVAHEINNPVNFISNSVSAIEERINTIVTEKILPDVEMSDDLGRLFTNISAGIDKITKIVHSLRLYSRTDADTMSDADINELINSSLIMINHRTSHRISVEKHYTPLPRIKCQPGRLSQALISIISNSIDAIEDAALAGKIPEYGGKIIITTESREGIIFIRITDNGIGIDQAVMEKIFDPFFSTKGVGRGTGLGLSITQSIMRDHNATINVESINKNGTSVLVNIPAAGDKNEI